MGTSFETRFVDWYIIKVTISSHRRHEHEHTIIDPPCVTMPVRLMCSEVILPLLDQLNLRPHIHGLCVDYFELIKALG